MGLLHFLWVKVLLDGRLFEARRLTQPSGNLSLVLFAASAVIVPACMSHSQVIGPCGAWAWTGRWRRVAQRVGK